MAFKERGGKFTDSTRQFTDKGKEGENKTRSGKESESRRAAKKYAVGQLERKQTRYDGQIADRSGQRFREKSVLFLEGVENFYEDIRPVKREEPEVSRADDKMIVFTEHSRKKHKDAAQGYREAEREAGTELKKLKNEIKAEKTEQVSSEQAEKYFNYSNAKFVDPERAFCNPVEKKFRRDPVDAKKENLFVSSVMTGIRETGMGREEKREGGIKGSSAIKEQKEKIYERVTAMTDHLREKIAEVCFTDNKSTVPKSTVPGRHTPKSQDRDHFTKKEERMEQANKKKKDVKNKKNREKRKAASRAAFANVLRVKKNMQNDVFDMSGQTSGNLIRDGTGGVIKAADDSLRFAVSRNLFKFGNSLTSSTMSAIAGLTGKMKNYLIKMGSSCCILLFPLVIVMAIFMLISSSDMGDGYDLDGGDGYTFTSLSEDDIDQIIEGLYETYNQPDLGIYGMSITQEIVLRYALSKVGYPYSQRYHGSLTANIFDCSSLAFRSYREVNISIANGVAYSAAEEARAMVIREKVVLGNALIPGDLIFYGGANNKRYMGIYHVGIYVGNGKMVEARNQRMGVVYGDVRAGNVVLVGRPYS